MVNFGPVTPEFTRVICVHPSSISSGVSLATFASWRHCWALRRSVLNFVSLRFVRGRHCYGRWATCYALPRISSSQYFTFQSERDIFYQLTVNFLTLAVKTNQDRVKMHHRAKCLGRVSNHVEFEFRVRVRVSSKFSNFEGIKNVELFN